MMRGNSVMCAPDRMLRPMASTSSCRAASAIISGVIEELRKRGLDDVVVWAGGIIPEADVPTLKEMGIRAIFGPGSPTSETVEFLRTLKTAVAQ